MSNIVKTTLSVVLREKQMVVDDATDRNTVLYEFKKDMDEYGWNYKIISSNDMTFIVNVTSVFDDQESDEGTIQYLLEQDLEDAGWDCDIILKEGGQING